MSSPALEFRLGRLLVVAHDQAQRVALVRFLKHKGFEISSIESPDGLAGALEQSAADLVLMDTHSALAGGAQTIEALRPTAAGVDLPVILFGPGGDWPRSVGDIDGYLRWPFQLPQLLAAILACKGANRFHRPKGGLTVPAGGPDPAASSPGALPHGSRGFGPLFVHLWKHAATCAVTLRIGGTQRRIEFLNGFPVGAQSTLVSEHLLRFLLRQGVIQPDAYRRLLPDAQKRDWNARRSLVGHGVITPEEFDRAQRELLTEIALQCLLAGEPGIELEPTAVPAADADPVSVNPFELYRAWLQDPRAAAVLTERFAGIAASGLRGTPGLTHHHHLVARELEVLPQAAMRFDAATAASEVARAASDPAAARAVLVTLVDLGILDVGGPPVVAQPLAHALDGATAPRFERLRQMVEVDRARVARAREPYGVLGLPNGAAGGEVRSTFRRLSRLYRTENFERIGDDSMLETTEALRTAFRNAAAEILGVVPEDEGTSRDSSSSGAPLASPADQEAGMLAQVFFEDGQTYLKVEDYDEALDHFRRCVTLMPTSATYMAHEGYALFKRAGTDLEQVARAKSVLIAALRLENRNDRALYFLGCVYEALGRTERAKECWESAVRLNSANFDAHAALRRLISTPRL